jgi:hypothetical protein
VTDPLDHAADYAERVRAEAAAPRNGQHRYHPDADDSHGPPDPPPAPPLVIARPASAYFTAPVDWLWEGRVPCGALTVLDGDPGLGKSTITLDLAARVSRGYAMPPDGGKDGTPPANVVILSAEDDPARTIRPRLEAAGADLDRVQIVEGISTGGDGDRFPILPYDLVALEQFIAVIRARLAIVDPFMAYLGDGIDTHKDQSIRLARRKYRHHRRGAVRFVAGETPRRFRFARPGIDEKQSRPAAAVNCGFTRQRRSRGRGRMGRRDRRERGRVARGRWHAPE